MRVATAALVAATLLATLNSFRVPLVFDDIPARQRIDPATRVT